MGWLIFIGYIVVWFFSTKYFARVLMKDLEDNHPILVRTLDDYVEQSRTCVLFGSIFAILWPTTLPGHLAWRAIRHVLLGSQMVIETPRYKEMKDRRELEEFRRMAREHGLALPEALDK